MGSRRGAAAVRFLGYVRRRLHLRLSVAPAPAPGQASRASLPRPADSRGTRPLHSRYPESVTCLSGSALVLVHRQNRRVLELFPDTARIDGGALSIGGIAAAELVRAAREPARRLRRGDAPRPGARLPRGGAGRARLSTGRRRSRTSRVMRILAEEGIGADVSTLGELRFAQAAGIGGDASSSTATTSPREELARRGRDRRARRRRLARGGRPGARGCGVSRTLIRVTPGIEADTHETIRTGHHGSKFGLTPDDALEALRRAPGDRGPPRPHRLAAPRSRRGPARRSTGSPPSRRAPATSSAGTLRTLDLGGGLGVAATPDEPELPIAEFVARRCSPSSSGPARRTGSPSRS